MVETIIVAGRIRDLAGLHRLRRAHAVRPDARISTRMLLPVYDGQMGGDMATASIEVSGPNAERDRAAEAVTRFNVAMIHRAEGELGRAVAELERVVELDRQVSRPDLQSDIEVLDRVRQELGSSDRGRGSR
jgi:hypothetical protein